ncbi:MAG: alpha/beta hydrolase, partial [Armatimonadota bacterium]
MKSELEGLRHPRLGYHEQPGAGHWWGGPCVDWPPMFAMFERARLDPHPREATFTTVNPAIASRYAWVEIVQQIRSALPSTVRLKYDPTTGTVEGTTTNVATLR